MHKGHLKSLYFTDDPNGIVIYHVGRGNSEDMFLSSEAIRDLAFSSYERVTSLA